MILGIDEVGRGPWAGPLVMGAVILGGVQIEGLTDSKKLTKKRRDELDIVIREKALACGLGWVSATEIDEIGLSRALQLACQRAIEAVDALRVAYSEIIIDGAINFLKETKKGKYVTTMKKADLLVPAVSAASIIAKVARDNYMAGQDSIYPGYGFVNHVGYGTAAHVKAIEQLGVTPLHRLSFAPLQKYQSASKTSTVLTRNVHGQTTRQIGDVSETAAANELMRRGHEIIDRNWKTKYCEIDIISKKDGTLYFTEVKHRKNSKAGDGLAAITPKKLNQMKFAAKFYAHASKLEDIDLRLVAIATASDMPEVISFVEIID